MSHGAVTLLVGFGAGALFGVMVERILGSARPARTSQNDDK